MKWTKKIDKDSGLYYYLDENGNTSEFFEIALDYDNDGFAIVKQIGENIFRFRDSIGNISKDGYAMINSEYVGIFAPRGFYAVKETKGSESKYRDFIGNLSKDTTKKGFDYCDYINDKKTVFDLDLSCFGDDKFLKAIIDKENLIIMQAKENCYSQEDILKLNELNDYICDYISNKAYEAHQFEIENGKVF